MTALLRRIPRSVQLAAVLSGALTLTLSGAVGAAMQAPGSLGFTLAQIEPLDYAQDAAVTFRPVGFGLIEELIGPGGLFGVGGGSGSGVVASGDGIVPIGPGQDPGPGTGPLPPGEDPSGGTDPPIEDRPTIDPQITLEVPVLTLTFTADRTSAARGGTIKYSLIVRNDGSATASNVRVDSHAPEGTTFQGQENCQGDPVSVLPGDGTAACVDADDFLPAPDYEPGEHFGKTISKLLPGQHESFVFSVKVDAGTPSGTRIRNHAHASAVNADGVHSPNVIVRVS